MLEIWLLAVNYRKIKYAEQPSKKRYRKICIKILFLTSSSPFAKINETGKTKNKVSVFFESFSKKKSDKTTKKFTNNKLQLLLKVLLIKSALLDFKNAAKKVIINKLIIKIRSFSSVKNDILKENPFKNIKVKTS
jgi:hypothetical protein